LAGKSEGNRGNLWRPRQKWKKNTKINLKKIGCFCAVCNEVAQDWVKGYSGHKRNKVP